MLKMTSVIHRKIHRHYRCNPALLRLP